MIHRSFQLRRSGEPNAGFWDINTLHNYCAYISIADDIPMKRVCRNDTIHSE